MKAKLGSSLRTLHMTLLIAAFATYAVADAQVGSSVRGSVYQEPQAVVQHQAINQAVRLSHIAPEVVPGLRFTQHDGDLFLCNNRLALTFRGAAAQFGLKSLVDLQTRREFVMPGYDNDLFRVELRPKHAFVYGHRTVFPSDASPDNCAWKLQQHEDKVVLVLTWQDVPASKVINAVNATATIELGPTGLSRWKLSVENRMDSYGLWTVDFPRMPAIGASGLDAESSDFVAVPLKLGRRWDHPRHM